MRKQIIAMVSVITIVFLTVKTQAQIVNVPCSPDSSILLEKIYAGILGTTAYTFEKDTVANSVDIRLGAAARYSISKSFILKGFTALDVDAGTKTFISINAFWLQYTPSKNVLIEGGYAPTLVAQQHRPHPVTQLGQFEPTTPARLPGCAPSANIQFIPNTKLLFGGGVSVTSHMLDYQLTTKIGRVQLTGYYQSYDSLIGGVCTYTDARFATTLIYKSNANSVTPANNVIANLATYQISKKRSLVVYSDFGYSTDSASDHKDLDKRIIRWEGGIIKTFTFPSYGRGLFCLGYAYETKSVKAYLQVTL